MLWCPPPMGVVVGPLRPTRVISSEAKTSSGINWPCSVSARRPASTRSHSIAAPVASTARTGAAARLLGREDDVVGNQRARVGGRGGPGLDALPFDSGAGGVNGAHGGVGD